MQIEAQQTTKVISRRIECGGERLWRFEDFEDLPPNATAQALSRLSRAGKLQRLSKGIYYRPRKTPFGKSRASPAKLESLLPKGCIFPSGISAANLLGFTTQIPKQKEIATSAGSLPRKLIGEDTIVHTRRPAYWDKLTEEEAAWLDFLRNAGKVSELSPEETANRAIALLKEKGLFERLSRTVISEPPRSRAILGALGEKMGKKSARLSKLRDSLNPLSRYDFGKFADLSTAPNWFAKKK